MKTIKQEQHTKHCLICCAAMVLDKEYPAILLEVNSVFCDKEFLGTYVPMKEIARLLAMYGKSYGAILAWEKPIQVEPEESSLFNIEIEINCAPAILTVMSNNYPTCTHAVVYDPEVKMVRDPDPKKKDLELLKNYEIFDWMIIGEYTDHLK